MVRVILLAGDVGVGERAIRAYVCGSGLIRNLFDRYETLGWNNSRRS